MTLSVLLLSVNERLRSWRRQKVWRWMERTMTLSVLLLSVNERLRSWRRQKVWRWMERTMTLSVLLLSVSERDSVVGDGRRCGDGWREL